MILAEVVFVSGKNHHPLFIFLLKLSITDHKGGEEELQKFKILKTVSMWITGECQEGHCVDLVYMRSE